MYTKSKRKKININLPIGNLIVFGSLDMILSLKLEKSDIFSNKINFSDINSLEDILFLTEDKSLWSRFELIPNNELMKILTETNKISNKKNIIAYLIYDKLNYEDIKNKFSDLFDSVLFDNGFIIQSYEIVACKIKVEIELIYNKNRKKITLFDIGGKPENQENEDLNNEEFQENEKIQGKENGKYNDEGSFSKIPFDEINFNNFKYIYFHLDNYLGGGEFTKSLNINNLICFIKKLKKKSKIKIIINIANNFPELEDDFFMLLKISDIHFIRNKNMVLNVLKNEKQTKDEIAEKNKEREIFEMKESKRVLREQQKNENQNNNKLSNRSSEYNKSIFKKSLLTNESQTCQTERIYNNNMMNLNLTNKNDFDFYSSRGTNNDIILNLKDKSIDKTNMFIYMRQLLYKDNISKDNKLGIYINEFNKIYFVDYSKSNFFTNVTEYNIQLYPKLNVHNIEEIEKIKNFLKKNEIKYYQIYYGGLIGAIVNNNYIEENNYHLIYSICNICLEKILVFDINKCNPPKNKNYYIVKIKKEEINKSLIEENNKKREQGFNNNIYPINYKKSLYNPLLDKYSRSFLQSAVHLKDIKTNDLINKKGYILYDPVYKEIFKREPYNLKNSQDKEFYNFIQKSNIKKINLKGKDYFNEYSKKKSEMKYKLPGINNKPEHYLYYSGKPQFKKTVLPKIRKNRSQPDLIVINEKNYMIKNEEEDQKEDKKEEETQEVKLEVKEE